MRPGRKRASVAAAVGAALVLGPAAPVLAAHDSQADARNDELIAEGNPGWEAMIDAPANMSGMYYAPPMAEPEHPGPDNPPDVVANGPGSRGTV